MGQGISRKDQKKNSSQPFENCNQQPIYVPQQQMMANPPPVMYTNPEYCSARMVGYPASPRQMDYYQDEMVPLPRPTYERPMPLRRAEYGPMESRRQAEMMDDGGYPGYPGDDDDDSLCLPRRGRPHFEPMRRAYASDQPPRRAMYRALSPVPARTHQPISFKSTGYMSDNQGFAHSNNPAAPIYGGQLPTTGTQQPTVIYYDPGSGAVTGSSGNTTVTPVSSQGGAQGAHQPGGYSPQSYMIQPNQGPGHANYSGAYGGNPRYG